MRYQDHPLRRDSEGRSDGSLPSGDRTPVQFPDDVKLATVTRLKLEIGRRVYPVKNWLDRPLSDRRLRALGADPGLRRKPDRIMWGPRGISIEILGSLLARMLGGVESVLLVGCGSGHEALRWARFLRPRRLVGYDFFEHTRAWQWVSECLARQGTVARFAQRDLAQPLPTSDQVDLVISNAVLEHLRDMDIVFANIRPALREPGWFFAVWGPLWYSYSGDHIAPELGFEAGYSHVELDADHYRSFYRSHPRNVSLVQSGEPTWLELGLHNFGRYDEYMAAIEAQFGPPRWLGWSISAEGARWAARFPHHWRSMLDHNSHIDALDLLLHTAAVLNGPVCPGRIQ